MRGGRDMVPVGLAVLTLHGCSPDPMAPTSLETGICGRETRLRAGEAVELGQADSLCISVPFSPEGRFILAFFDTRVVKARREGVTDDVPPVTIGVGPGPTSASVVEAHGSLVTGGAVEVCDDTDATGLVMCRTGPWSAGERAPLDPVPGPGYPDPPPDTGRVLAVAHGVAYLHYEPHREAFESRGIEAALDTVLPLLEEFAVPPLAAAFGERRPVTTREAGQLAVIFSEAGSFASANEISSDPPDRPFVNIDPRHVFGAASLFGLLVHELTHAWQFNYLLDTGQYRYPGRSFGVEGTAELMVHEALRLYLAIPLDANWDLRRESARGPWHRRLADLLGSNSGALEAGYGNAAALLRHLVAYLVLDGGVPYDEALREVSRGAVVGWYAEGGPEAGLTSRLSTATGRPWRPETEVMDWLLALVMDDRDGWEGAQDRTFLEVWRALAPTGTASATEGVLAKHPAGSAGWFELVAGTPAASVPVTADRPGLAWALARIR